MKFNKTMLKLPLEITVAAASAKILVGDNYFYLLGFIAILVILYRFGNE
jgi:hypothetical protein